MTRGWGLGTGDWAFGAWLLTVMFVIPVAGQEMPDPSQMHGRPLPAPELAAGTVTVRVVREAMGNDMPGQEVRVTVNGQTRTATTDDFGRAEFTGLPAGAEAVAEATVEGEELVSQPFAVPASGGVRVALVAGLERAAERRKQEEAAAAAAPPTKGTVIIGGDSRIVMEFNNDSLFAFYVLDVVNNARARVDIGGPLVIDLPEGIAGVQLMPSASPTATIEGTQVIVQGPFASGTTPVHLQFQVTFGTPERVLTQTFPVPLERVVVGIEKVAGELAMASPQLRTINDLPTETGPYLLGQGPALAAGTPLTITLSNLPAPSRTPRYVALALVLVIAGVGIWLAATARDTQGRTREALESRRGALLGELAQLEAKHRAGTIPKDRYEARRARLVAQLEQIYGELDETGAGPQGGGEGIAA